MFKGKNWKTTVGGIVAGGGAILTIFYPVAGKLLAGVGLAILGNYSKDRNVTGGTVEQ